MRGCHSAELGDKGGREADNINCGINDEEVDVREVAVDERAAGTDVIIGEKLRALSEKFNDGLILLQCQVC